MLGILPNILVKYLSRIYLAYILVKYIGQSETASPPLMVLLGDMAPVWPQSLHPVRVLWTEACHQMEKGFPKFYKRPTGLKSKTDSGTCGRMDRIVWNIRHSILPKIWKHYVPRKDWKNWNSLSRTSGKREDRGSRCERGRNGLFGKTATKESIRLSTSTNALLATIRTFWNLFF